MSPALLYALERIDQEFGAAAAHESRKRRTRRLIRLGLSDPEFSHETRLRYGWLADEAVSCNLDLDQMLIMLDRSRRLNRQTGRPVRLYGRPFFRMLNTETLFQTRTILRWMRRFAPAQFTRVRDAMKEA